VIYRYLDCGDLHNGFARVKCKDCLVTDGCFYGDGGMFRVAPPLELKKLEAIPRSGRGQASGTRCSECS